MTQAWAVVVAHTTGINWASLLVTVSAILGGVTIVGGVITKPWRAKLDGLGDQVAEVRADARTNAAATALAAVSVARIEGYLAASNGGGFKLPETPVSKALASDEVLVDS